MPNQKPNEHKEQTATVESRHSLYDENVTSISAEASDLLCGYAGYSPDEVLSDVLKFRDLAFSKYEYACIGQMRFLQYSLRILPFYPRILARLRAGATFLDAGCCFGQELRYLTHVERIPSSQLFGFDLEPTFLDLGCQLFHDADRFRSHLVAADLLRNDSNNNSTDDATTTTTITTPARDLTAFDGKIDVIFCASFLHVWPYDDMVAAATRLVQLTTHRPPSAGHVVICGKQLGSRRPGHYAMPTPAGRHYRHDPGSMAAFWQRVGRETGTAWAVDAGFYDGVELVPNQAQAWSDAEQCMLWFCATKL